MNRRLFGIAAVASALSLTACKEKEVPNDRPPTPPPDLPKVVAEGNRQFAWDLYGKLREKESNLFFSPVSVSTALAMTSSGAKGDTLKEMLAALHLPEGNETHAAMGALLNHLAGSDRKKDGYEASVANALWGQKSYSFKQDFLDGTKKNYGAGLTPVDFASATEEARKTINAWVEKQTRYRIRDLLQPGVLNANTRLVLTNAIYFKGDWAKPFKQSATRDRDFTPLDGKKVSVPTMHASAEFAFAQNDDLKLLDLAYRGDRLSMTILLPVKKDGLPELEKRFTPENLAKWLEGLHSTRDLRVELPKFKVESQFGLKQTLAALGMKTTFDPSNADFSGMDGTHELFVSDVVHKAFVEVNEEGTEAAAATAVVMDAKSAERREAPPEFVADHPFAFVIRDRKTNTILFAGRVANPK